MEELNIQLKIFLEEMAEKYPDEYLNDSQQEIEDKQIANDLELWLVGMSSIGFNVYQLKKIKFKNATVYMPGELEKEAEFDEISNFMDEFVSNLAAKYKNKTLTTEEIDEIYATEIQDFNNKLSDMDLLAIPLIVLKTIDNILRYKGE